MKFNIPSYSLILVAMVLLTGCQKSNIGKKFPTKHLVDLKGIPISSEQVQGNKKTIIDYWFIGCKPCLAEMKKFPDLLQKDKDLKIISISVDAYPIWKKALFHEIDSLENDVEKYIEMSGVQNIVKNNVRNWVHYNYDDKRSKGWPKIEELDINAYPTYFLLDEHAIILKQANKVEDCLKH